MNVVPNEEADRPKSAKESLKCVKIYLDPQELSEVQELMRLSGYSSVGLWLKRHVLKSYAKIMEQRLNKAKEMLDWDFTVEELQEARKRLMK